jgi:hypothetical protein
MKVLGLREKTKGRPFWGQNESAQRAVLVVPGGLSSIPVVNLDE